MQKFNLIMFMYMIVEHVLTWYLLDYLEHVLFSSFDITVFYSSGTQQEPRHFCCGFDIVLPCSEQYVPEWFDDRFNGV